MLNATSYYTKFKLAKKGQEDGKTGRASEAIFFISQGEVGGLLPKLSSQSIKSK